MSTCIMTSFFSNKIKNKPTRKILTIPPKKRNPNNPHISRIPKKISWKFSGLHGLGHVWRGEFQVDQRVLLEGTQHTSNGSTPATEREEPGRFLPADFLGDDVILSRMVVVLWIHSGLFMVVVMQDSKDSVRFSNFNSERHGFWPQFGVAQVEIQRSNKTNTFRGFCHGKGRGIPSFQATTSNTIPQPSLSSWKIFWWFFWATIKLDAFFLRVKNTPP